MSATEQGIASLDVRVASLSAVEREVFNRIFKVTVSRGQLNPPPTMHSWIEEHFGSVEKTREQRVIRVTNLVTGEEALFNKLRESRPIKTISICEVPASDIGNMVEPDPFDKPLLDTPEDVFGRIEGEYCISASNVAKYEGFHGVIIFNEPDPLRFNKEQVVDYIDTGYEWAQKAHSVDSEAKYYLFMWNCGGRAGASLPHGHAQVMLGRSKHYARVEQLRRAAISYRQQYGTNYFDDLYSAHSAFGVGFESTGTKVLTYLTPVKEKEVVLFEKELGRTLKEKLYEVLACFRDEMRVTAFNVVLLIPPIAHTDEDWEGFPAIIRIVDRGNVVSKASDIGTMELYAANVIASDPFEITKLLKECLGKATD